MSLKVMVPFKSLDAVSYSPSIVTMVVPIAVCEIFRVCDLENRVTVRSRSLEMAPIDRLHTSLNSLLKLFAHTFRASVSINITP